MIRKGTKVTWNWGNGTATGKVAEVHHDRVTRKTKGQDISRNGSEDNPALVIEQADGTTVLKLHSEVDRA